MKIISACYLNYSTTLLLILTIASFAICQIPFHEKLYWGKNYLKDWLLVIPNLSLAGCIRECKLRPGCLSVTYKRRFRNCAINDIAVQPEDLPFDSRAVYTQRPDWRQDITCTPACTTGQRCNPETRTCKINECNPPPSIPNAIVKGNMRFVGNRVQYRCTTDTSKTFTSVCLDTGTWSTVRDCPQDCGPLPQVEHSYPVLTGGTYEGQSRQYKCDEGYYQDPNTASNAMVTACQANGQWTPINFQCIKCPDGGTGFICEGKKSTICCFGPKQLAVTFAGYGRNSTEVCVHPSGQKTCGQKNVSEKVRTGCYEKDSCEIFASNGEFGDYCPGIYKYLEVTFECN